MEIKRYYRWIYNEKWCIIYTKGDEKVNNKMLYNIVKRVTFDIVVSLCTMISLLPLFVVIGILIKNRF